MVPKTRDLPQYHHVVGAMLRVVLWGLGRHNARVPVIFLFYSISSPSTNARVLVKPCISKSPHSNKPYHIYIYAHTHTYVRTYMCTYIHVHICIILRNNNGIYIYIYIYIYLDRLHRGWAAARAARCICQLPVDTHRTFSKVKVLGHFLWKWKVTIYYRKTLFTTERHCRVYFQYVNLQSTPTLQSQKCSL
jgi:hypothetical protein